MKTKIGFYGDDFTGASDNAAQYHRHGLRTILFFARPGDAALRQAAEEYDVIGVAGTARSARRADMAAEVLPVLHSLRQLPLRVVQYKCCSTLDSTSETGSLGEAARLMRSVWPGSFVPVLGAAPEFGRYTLFGNHFARARDVIYRLDRHPTMSRHPVTPMHEADIRRLFEEQGFPIERLVDLPELDAAQSDPAAHATALGAQHDAAVYDSYSVQQLTTAAGSIWEISATRPVTAVAAQGFAFGLGNYLKQQAGANRESRPEPADTTQHLPAADRILVVSGSCSPQSAAQIDWAEQNGFHCIRVAPHIALTPDDAAHAAQLAAVREQSIVALNQGRSVLIYTARGLDDPAIAQTREVLDQLKLGNVELADRVGKFYADLIRAAIAATGLHRIVVAGGDSSSFTMRHLRATALTVQASHFIQNAHICRILADDAQVDGIEVLLKGGQVGTDDLYGIVRDGFTLKG
jgi:uncharacterized protein YgbK (DUF1537 family)